MSVASSSRPGADEAFQALAASSLPTVIWREFLAGEGGGSAGVLGWSWWERGEAEGGGVPLAGRWGSLWCTSSKIERRLFPLLRHVFVVCWFWRREWNLPVVFFCYRVSHR